MTARLVTAARAAGLAMLAAALPAAADQPLWELGLGASVLHLPHYRGSDQTHLWLLPVPYVIYRGDIFKADRDGARALLLRSDRFDLNLSVNASAPTRSDDNSARRGMDDLAPTIEFGPKLNVNLARTPQWTLDMRAPLRGVVTLESSPRSIGWSATPSLNLDLLTLPGWNLGLQGGPVFGSRRLHAYFYDVPLAQASAERPAYRAPGGFAGTQYTAALSRHLGADERWWIGMFARYDSLHGARFDASPLLRKPSNHSFGVALVRVFATSSQRVREPD